MKHSRTMKIESMLQRELSKRSLEIKKEEYMMSLHQVINIVNASSLEDNLAIAKWVDESEEYTPWIFRK